MVSIHQRRYQVLAAIGAAVMVMAMAPTPSRSEKARSEILTHLKDLGDRINDWKATAEYNNQQMKKAACSLKGFRLFDAQSQDGDKPDLKGGFLFACKMEPREDKTPGGPAGEG